MNSTVEQITGNPSLIFRNMFVLFNTITDTDTDRLTDTHTHRERKRVR